MNSFMKYKGYFGSIDFDEEDMIFFGKLEFIRSSVSYEATTAKQLVKSFHEAVDDYLAFCKHQKTEPEKPFKGSLNVRIGPELHRDVAIKAAANNQSINSYIAGELSKAVRKK